VISGGNAFRRDGRGLAPAAKCAEPEGQVGLELTEGLQLAHSGVPGVVVDPEGPFVSLPPPRGVTLRDDLLWYHSSTGSVKTLSVRKPLDSHHLTLKKGTSENRWWASLLACPDCGAGLSPEGGQPGPCSGCGRMFTTAAGVPVLAPLRTTAAVDDGHRFFIEEPGRLDSLRQTHPRLARLLDLPDFTTPSKALPECSRWFRQHVLEMVPGEQILNLGSGVRKVYDNPNLLNFDIAPHENAHIVGDGEHLPFRSGVFDGVILDAVIEHLAHPHRVVAEVRRVLKPGGTVLAQVPFLYPFHAAPHDYQRYTPAGLRALFEEFKVLEAGTDRRPGRAVLEIMSAYAATFSDNRSLSYALRWVTAWAWLPIKFLDPWLARKSRSSDVVAGASILACKRIDDGDRP
jgi:hypothetical protein